MDVYLVHVLLDREPELGATLGPSVGHHVHDEASRSRTSQGVWWRGCSQVPVLVHEVVPTVPREPVLDPSPGLDPEVTERIDEGLVVVTVRSVACETMY